MKAQLAEKSKPFLAFCAFFIACPLFGLGWLAGNYYGGSAPNAKTVQLRENSPKYKLINSLLLVDNSEVEFFDFDQMEARLRDFIADETKNDDATKVSVYYRDLNSGKWSGVNEKDEYIPSSMLKVPTLIAYMKIAEDNPDVLSEEVNYAPKKSPGQFYEPSKLLAAGTYQVRRLLQEMIVKSENDANKILNDLHYEKVLDVYTDLQLPDPLKKDDSDDDFMSPEEYSKIFRVLYNSSYLPQSYSENALKLLTATEFDGGIVGGVAKDTLVAHKFGEHSKEVNGAVTERQLHDCGIVYYPGHPYFVCIMTKGQDFEKLRTVISDASEIVFDEVSKKYPVK